MVDERLTVARHEAVHAVVALSQGFTVLNVSIVPTEEQLGGTLIDRPPGWYDGRKYWFRAEPWLHYILAPTAVFGLGPHVQDDLARAADLIGELKLADPNAYARARLREARQLADENRTAIEATADALIQHNELSGDAVRQVVARSRP